MRTGLASEFRSTKFFYISYFTLFILVYTLSTISNKVVAQTFYLAVQPIFSKDKTITFYQPLASYLSQATGHEIKIFASANFVSYWEELRSNKKYDLALDAAHFTNYRVKNLNYTVLAKIADTVSYSLITNEEDTYFDAEELIGQRIATSASPSIGGVRLLSLYPNPTRQPVFIGTNNFQDTLTKLKTKKVTAALIPTPFISGDSSVNTIMVTEPIPHMAISASSRVNKTIQDKIRKALLEANTSTEGKQLYQQLNLSGFEKANNLTYVGYERLLQDVWGY